MVACTVCNIMELSGPLSPSRPGISIPLGSSSRQAAAGQSDQCEVPSIHPTYREFIDSFPLPAGIFSGPALGFAATGTTHCRLFEAYLIGNDYYFTGGDLQPETTCSPKQRPHHCATGGKAHPTEATAKPPEAMMHSCVTLILLLQ